MISRRAIAWVVCASLWLSGCADSLFNVSEGTYDEATYAALYPWYAEFCALSEIDKKPGFGAEVIAGGPGGHSILYLNGVCRQKDAGYPVVALCGTGDPKPGQGVAFSVNDHYRNANWIATEGRDFVFHGDLLPGEPLTKEAYLRTQAKAKAMGILDGVEFHSEFFENQPSNIPKIDLMYDLSIATDYAVGFGRDRYCARVPLDRARVGAMVNYMNAINAPYRDGQIFEWNIFWNNCTHLSHNVLALAGVWAEEPTGQPPLIAVLDFPVPKNEFVNLMRRTNEMPIAYPDALYDDDVAREAVLDGGLLATRPGGLAEAERAIQRNDVYNTNLHLIFYDEPITGRYRRWFNQIFREPRFTNPRANLDYFANLYTTILARRPAEPIGGTNAGPRADYYNAYYRAIAADKAKLDHERDLLSALPGQRS